MKYVKFFEGFESSIISKTLSYIKDKKNFISELQLICDKYDVELSKLNDDMFKYLPLNKAIKYHSASEEKSTNELNAIKFWFSKEGNYVNKTGDVSNRYIKTSSISDLIDQFKKHQNIEDYDIVSRISVDELARCSDGTVICFLSSLPGYEDSEPVVSFLYKKY